MVYQNKTKQTAKSPSAFLNSLDDDQKKKDSKRILAMMKKITGKSPKMWGPTIIGFGKYTYKRKD